MNEKWTRQEEGDRRIKNGDDFNGDAWKNRAGMVSYSVPTYNKNTGERQVEKRRGHQDDESYIF
jgi:hypothetical protein